MTDTITEDLKQKIALEGLQMASEANSVAMIINNARLEMIAEAVGVDISTPKLTEVEERNKNLLLESVARRMATLLTYGAELDGAPAPSSEEINETLKEAINEIWPEGSTSDRRSTPSEDPMPVVDPVDTPIPEWQQALEESHPDTTLVSSNIPDDIEPELDAKLAEAIRSGEFIADSPEVVEAVFKSRRAATVPDGTFDVSVWPLEQFEDYDLTDSPTRKALWDTIVEQYSDAADAAVEQNWINAEWAERLKQEFRLSPTNQEITSSLTLPEPGDVANGVAKTAARGEGDIEISGITSQEEVVEAIMTAFMVTMARMNMAASAALLPSRLAQMGMAPDVF